MSVEVTKSKLFLKYSKLPFSFIKMQMHSIDFVPFLLFRVCQGWNYAKIPGTRRVED